MTRRSRRLLWTVLAVLIAVPVCWWIHEKNQSSRRLEALSRLWFRGGRTLELSAFGASITPDGSDGAGASPEYPPWDKWPARSRESVLWGGLSPVATEKIDALVATSFRMSDDRDARFYHMSDVSDSRWYYVVAGEEDPEDPWFVVIGIDAEFVLYARRPHGIDFVIEDRDRDEQPHQIIKRICSQRE